MVITVGAAWLTARLAPDRPLRHAIILGYVGTVLGLAGAAATWNRGLGPHWYAIAIALLALPECWVGGKLYELQAGKRVAGRVLTE
jgi:RsiW-degrading membrane proteinase PrsW (M82 family)